MNGRLDDLLEERGGGVASLTLYDDDGTFYEERGVRMQDVTGERLATLRKRLRDLDIRIAAYRDSDI